ncbi:MAG: FAD-dependent monooxygenase [Firmicutes bacterium]|nr:FAD-dependent monooxygenase [Bacillota bacterium]
MKTYDAVIIGAGTAGCTLGYLLLQQGKSVLIIEKNKTKLMKPCGGLLTQKTVNLMTDIFGVTDLQLRKYDSFLVKNNKPLLNLKSQFIASAV